MEMMGLKITYDPSLTLSTGALLCTVRMTQPALPTALAWLPALRQNRLASIFLSLSLSSSEREA